MFLVFFVFSPSALIFVIIWFEAAQMDLVWWNRLFSSGWKQDQDTLQRIRLPDLPARTFLWENSQRVGCKDHFYTAHSPDTRLVLELFFWKHRLDYVTTFSCQASRNLHLPNKLHLKTLLLDCSLGDAGSVLFQGMNAFYFKWVLLLPFGRYRNTCSSERLWKFSQNTF